MPTSERTSILRGATLTIAMRWADRLIGIVSTLILARLLAPEDLGIIAMSALVVGLADMLLDLGVEAALIQNREAGREHYDSAWTMRLLQMCISAGVVIAAAPFAAAYFGEPRVLPVLQVTALSLVLGGLENIGVVNFRKEMRFGKDFQFVFIKRITGFAVTMVAAWLLENYWALVIGALAGRMLGVVLSYLMHPMRPRLCFGKIREIFGFSQWMLIQGLGNYLDVNLHRFMVGGRAGSAVLGGYSLAGDVAGIPSNELLMPLNRVLFPAFAEVKHDWQELRRKFLLAQAVQTLVALPAAVGLALVADDFVPLLLSEKWTFAIPFVQILAIASVVRALSGSSSYVMLTLGLARRTAALAWFRVVVFVALAVGVFAGGDATSLAFARGWAAVAGMIATAALLIRSLPIVRVCDLLATIWRPVVALSVMACVLSGLGMFLSGTGWALLLVKVLAGAVSYTATVCLCWWRAGRPSGAEQYLFQSFLRPALGRWLPASR